jgi:sporulation protein YlmC with PRC-barrel domain
MGSVPSDSLTVTDWYKQPLYDPNNNKLGDVKDVLVDRSGKINAVILGVGGILGAGEKDVAVPFEAVKKTTKNNEAYLTLDITKDNLKSGPGFKYDKTRQARSRTPPVTTPRSSSACNLPRSARRAFFVASRRHPLCREAG